MHDLHQELLSKNTLYRKWHGTPHHRVMHWAILVIVATALTNGVLNAINVTYVGAQTSGVQYTYNAFGLQSLTYGGFNYITGQATDNSYNIVPTVLFQAPDGTQKPYGWLANSLDNNLSIGTTIKTTGTAPDYTNQIYRPGKTDSFTVKYTYSTPDTRTMKIGVDVTNNDTVDTLTQITLGYFWWLTTPGAVTKEVPYLGANLFVGSHPVSNLGDANPASYASGNWGSFALYSDKFDTNWSVYSGTFRTDDITGQTKFLIELKNNSQIGGPTNVSEEPILPGQTAHYTFYIRFGSPTDTGYTLAPEAYTSFRNAYPFIVNWPNRNPLAVMFLGDNSTATSKNPRGYWWDSTIDVVPLTPTKQAVFNSKILTLTDNIIARMNSWNPRPQGIMIWDLEGDEFEQYFTYVGYPNKLHDLNPEMDAVADQMIQKYKTAGYKVGLTLRPSDFQTGLTAAMPATCHSDSVNHDANDVYIATDGVFPFRGYSCTSPNTWNNHGFVDQTRGQWPYYQHAPQDDATLLANLRSKVAYAKNRWGISIFYVDSSVYSNNGGGNSLDFRIFRQLQQEFPDTLFAPENEGYAYYGTSAGYNSPTPHLGGNVNDTPSEARNMYPQAFSMLANYDQINFADPAVHQTFLNSIKGGNIYIIDGWWDNPNNAEILSLYREAGTAGSDTTVPVASISSPINGATVSGFASVAVTATDNIGVTRVEFWKDGVLNTTLTTSPYNFSWNTSGDTNGSHTIQVKAYDAAGNVGVSALVNVTVSNIVTPPADTTLPITSITSPSNGATVSGTINVTTSASDNIGVTRVELWKDSSLFNSLTSAPYTFSFDTTQVANGSHTLQSKAYDAAGNVGVSTIVNVTVSNVVTPPPPPPPPPADTTPPSAPGGITVSVTAQPAVNIAWTPSTDDVAVTGYKVFRNGSQIASITSTSYTDTAVSAGSAYDYTVTASDAAGNVSVPSDTASVTIPNPQATNVSITSNSVSKKTANTTTIVWVTNVPSTGMLRYGTNQSNLNLTATDITTGVNHAVILTGLTKSTKYYYQITATAVTGGSTDTSSVTMWRTQPK